MDDVPKAPDYHSQESILGHARADHAGTRSGARSRAREAAQQYRKTLGARAFFGKCESRRLTSDEVIGDDVFERLLTFPTVLVTGHQGVFTSEARAAIAETTMANIASFEKSRPCRS